MRTSGARLATALEETRGVADDLTQGLLEQHSIKNYMGVKKR